MKVMVSITDKLAEANKELKSEDASIMNVSKLLAEAGKMSSTLDVDIMETIEITEEFEFMNTTLEEFVEFELGGLLETEESAMEAIVTHQDLVECAEKYQKAFEDRIKKAEVDLELQLRKR